MPVIDPQLVEVTPYDFRRPAWIGRERRAVLDGVHARMTADLEEWLGRTLRPPVRITVADVAQVTFSDWKRSLAAPLTAFAADLGPGEGGGATLCCDTAFARRMLDRVLGGSGEVENATHPLSALEKTLLVQLMNQWLAVIASAYGELAPFRPASCRFEDIVESLTMVEPHERILLLVHAVDCDGVQGQITLALPASRIAAFAGGAVSTPRQAPSDGAATRAMIARTLLGARVEVRARLTGLRLAAREGARLEAGQVLTTGHSFGGTVEIDYGGPPAFLGALGKEDDHVALRLLEVAPAVAHRSRLLRRMPAP